MLKFLQLAPVVLGAVAASRCWKKQQWNLTVHLLRTAIVCDALFNLSYRLYKSSDLGYKKPFLKTTKKNQNKTQNHTPHQPTHTNKNTQHQRNECTKITKLSCKVTFHPAAEKLRLRPWNCLNHVCQGLASFYAAGSLRRVQRGCLLPSPGHSHLAGCLHIWQHLLLLSCQWQEKEDGTGTGVIPAIFSWPKVGRGIAFHLLHGHQLQPSCAGTALLAGLSQLHNSCHWQRFI